MTALRCGHSKCLQWSGPYSSSWSAGFNHIEALWAGYWKSGGGHGKEDQCPAAGREKDSGVSWGGSCCCWLVPTIRWSLAEGRLFKHNHVNKIVVIKICIRYRYVTQQIKCIYYFIIIIICTWEVSFATVICRFTNLLIDILSVM